MPQNWLYGPVAGNDLYENTPQNREGLHAPHYLPDLEPEGKGVLSLVYHTVNGKKYLDLKASTERSPGWSAEEILRESRKINGVELPLPGGLERKISEERRAQGMQRLPQQPKNSGGRLNLITSASP